MTTEAAPPSAMEKAALTASLGDSPNGALVRLDFGVESAGVPGMNCAITRWWPGADEQTGLLTRIAETLATSAEHSPNDLDIVVSRQPQRERQREFTFPHTKVPIERLPSWTDTLGKERRRISRYAGHDSIADCREHGLPVPLTLLIVDLPNHDTVDHLAGRVLPVTEAHGIFTLVTTRSWLLTGSDRYGEGLAAPHFGSRFVAAAIQMNPPPDPLAGRKGLLLAKSYEREQEEWAELHTWHPPFGGVGAREMPRTKTQLFRVRPRPSRP